MRMRARVDPRIKQVIVSLAATIDTVLIAASDGTLAADVRPLVRFNVQVIAEQNGRREQGYAGGGGRYGYRGIDRERPRAGVRARGRAPGAGESGCRRCTGRQR